MRHEFDPLGLAAAERGAGLPELEITESRVAQRFERPFDLREALEERDAFRDRQLQHLRDVPALVFDVERLAIETVPAARLAAHEGGRQEIHLQLDRARALALRAAALRAVEGKPSRPVAPHPRLGRLREERADVVKKTDVGGRRGTRGASDGRLVHFINGLDELMAGNNFPRSRHRNLGPWTLALLLQLRRQRRK